MNHSLSRMFVLTVVGFLLLLTPRRVCAQELALELFLLQEAGPANSINLGMGEPLRLRIQLTNQGKNAARLIPNLDPAAGRVFLQLIKPDGTSETLSTGRWQVRDLYLKEEELAPGKTLACDTFLYGKMMRGMNKHVYLFPEPGNYGLSAKFIGAANQPALTSPVAQIVVGAPVPKWEELQAAGIVEAIDGRSGSDTEQLRQIIKGIRNHPLQSWITQARQTIEAQVKLEPETLAESSGILTAYIKLPAGYPASGITSATCDGAPYLHMMLSDADKGGAAMIIKFRRQDIEAALAQAGEALDTSFVIRGAWQGESGARLFQGAASIKEIVGANLPRSEQESK